MTLKQSQPTPRSVVAAVIERHGKYLVCQRPSHKRHGNLWEFPGGKIEPGETLESATRREMIEELSLAVSKIGTVLLSVPDQSSGMQINFVYVEAEGEPQLLEHLALKWVSTEELPTLALAPSDRIFAEHLNYGGANGSNLW